LLTPKVVEQYQSIGGSPIRKWTETQGKKMIDLLDKISPQTAPHRFFVSFRYSNPLTEEAIASFSEEASKHSFSRAIAFSQYPQYSCSTSGSSLNQLWRQLSNLSNKLPSNSNTKPIKWSVIDRWYTEPEFIEAVADRIEKSLSLFPSETEDRTILLFSAHSLPMVIVNRGDSYPQEVCATVELVTNLINSRRKAKNLAPLRRILTWQSQVGNTPWLGPNTGVALEQLGQQGEKQILAIPIAFTSDHIETLFEIDQEYADVAKEAGIPHFHRSESLNDSPIFIQALANIVKRHMESNAQHSSQYLLKCPGCTNELCRTLPK
jgi:ferrochelatase